ncbi:MAG TPA: hypothetical protein VGG94_04780, partial [Chthoniobacterales bacterium]
MIRLIAVAFMFCSVALPAAEPPSSGTSTPSRVGQIYMFRGVIGAMTPCVTDFSRQLRAAGFNAFSYEDFLGHSIVLEIERNYARSPQHEPLVLVGYSSGSVTAVAIARRLNRSHIPVDLLVTLDPLASETVPENVRVCLNYYKQTIPGVSVLSGTTMKAEPAVRLENIKLKTGNHFWLLESPEVNAAVTAPIAALCSRRSSDSATAAHGLM